ncbi:MAG: hypothetical protein ACTSV7_15055 [Candidatus Baldrarchaeia archaeon]
MRNNRITAEVLKILRDFENALGFNKEEIKKLGHAHESFSDYINYNLLRDE